MRRILPFLRRTLERARSFPPGLVLGVLVSAVSSQLLMPPAWACSLLTLASSRPKIVIDSVLRQVPAGGDIVAICTFEICTSSKASLIDAVTGLALPYQVVRQGTDDLGQPWVVLRPDAPLAAGMRVQATLSGATTDYEVLPSEASEPNASDAHGSVVSRATPAGDPVCCEPHLGSCNFEQVCFYKAKQIGPVLMVYADDALYPRAPASQWLFRVTVTAEDMEPKQGAWFPSISRAEIPLDVPRSTYCFTLEAESLKDGTRVEVKSECRPNEVEFEEVPIPDFERTLALQDCGEPPPGHEDEWCEAFSRCGKPGSSGSLPSTNECQTAREVCDFPPVSLRPDAGTGGDPDAGQGGQLLDDHEGDGSLCSLGGAPRGSRALAWWFVLLGVGLWCRRRRSW